MLQLATEARNDRIAAITSRLGAGALLQFYSGTPPANPAAAPTGVLLAQGTLATPCFGTPSGGAATNAGTWEAIGSVAGTVGYFRLCVSSGALCVVQGTVTIVGGGGDMILATLTTAVGVPIGPASYTLVDGST